MLTITNNKPLSIFLLAFLLVISSCKPNMYKADVSGIEADIDIKRLEVDLFEADPADIYSYIPVWQKEYGSFLQLFSYVINAGAITDPMFSETLVNFCTDRQNNEVYDKLIELFPTLDDIENELENAFKRYLYYFPTRTIPYIYTCMTGFNNSLIIGDSIVGISLDRYLGRSSDYYPRLGLYNYVIARMASEYIVPDVIYGWASTEWDFNEMNYASENVLAEMIHDGKLRFFQKSMLPEKDDTLLFGFTADQMKFCRNNEHQMWMYLMEHDLLFATDQLTVRKLVGEAPFTSYFTNESPGRAATWIGFRIVESFMKNTDTSLSDMMAITDVQAILNGAKYAP